jgi:hypothetical protein
MSAKKSQNSKHPDAKEISGPKSQVGMPTLEFGRCDFFGVWTFGGWYFA